MSDAIKAAQEAIDRSAKIVEEMVAMIDRAPSVPDTKLLTYLQQENEVLIERVRKLEADADEYVQQLQIALHNCRAVAALEQEKPSGLHMTAFSLIQKYATKALGDEGLE